MKILETKNTSQVIIVYKDQLSGWSWATISPEVRPVIVRTEPNDLWCYL